MTIPTRPVLRWHGGKWMLAPKIIAHMPPHRIYVEPFGGAGSVLIRKPRAYCDVYNDLDDDVVGLFRVLQNPEQAARLRDLLKLTPFARKEFEIGWDETDDPVERARRLIIRAFMGFGSNAHSSLGRGFKTTGFRANSNKSGTVPAHDWENYPDALEAIIERFRGVLIEHRDACQVMTSHDGEDTLHYVDPPYLPETRSPANKYDGKYRMYRHELDGGGARRSARPPSRPQRLGAAERLSRAGLRRSAARLDAHRIRRAGRWRATAHRSAVDQSSMLASTTTRRPRDAAA